MIKRAFGAILVAAAAAVTLGAGPALAAPPPPSVWDTLFGSLSGPSAPGQPNPKPNPGTPGKPSANGVRSIAVTISGYNGKKLGPNLYATGVGLAVRWDARDAANAKVTGNDCQIEASISSAETSTHKTAYCGGYHYFAKINKPGSYTAAVVDRVSGARGSVSFKIE